MGYRGLYRLKRPIIEGVIHAMAQPITGAPEGRYSGYAVLAISCGASLRLRFRLVCSFLEADNEKTWVGNEKTGAPAKTNGVSGIIINCRRMSPAKEVWYGVV
jgi:hypothetical protein